MFPQEFTVPTDTLWRELGADSAALESATFLFTGLRSVTANAFLRSIFSPGIRSRSQRFDSCGSLDAAGAGADCDPFGHQRENHAEYRP